MNRISNTVFALLCVAAVACKGRPTTPPRASSLAVSVTHTCASYDDGSVWCWGENALGQLGDGTTVNQLEPVHVANINDAIDVGVGDAVSCAVHRSGRVSCWGRAHEDGGSRATPRVVSGIGDAVRLATFGTESCAIRRTGQLACWRPGGNATSVYDSIATAVEFVGPRGVRLRDGQTVDIGNVFGPEPYPSDLRATVVSLVYGSSCDLKASGIVECDAVSNRGVAGIAAVPGLSDAVEVGLVGRSGCARRRNGGVSCWNHERAAGAPPVTNTAHLASFAEQSGDQDHLCGILSDGNVVCWTEGAAGEARVGVHPPSRPFEGRIVTLPRTGAQ